MGVHLEAVIGKVQQLIPNILLIRSASKFMGTSLLISSIQCSVSTCWFAFLLGALRSPKRIGGRGRSGSVGEVALRRFARGD